MEILRTIYHYFSFLMNLLFFLILSPFFLLYIIIKKQIYTYHFGKELKRNGLDRHSIRQLKKATFKLRDLFKIINQQKDKNTI